MQNFIYLKQNQSSPYLFIKKLTFIFAFIEVTIKEDSLLALVKGYDFTYF